VPPDLVAEAKAKNDGGEGWTCFGESSLSGATAAVTRLEPNLGTAYQATAASTRSEGRSALRALIKTALTMAPRARSPALMANATE